MVTYQRDAEKPIRLGVVGVGSHAYRNILPTLTYLPVTLVAVADTSLGLAERTGAQYGARAYASAAEMYEAESLDAVILCVSPEMHPTLAIEAFDAGLHVWMEKPAATNVADVRRMIAAQGGRICVVGYKKAFMPSIQKARELLGALDDPLRTTLAIYPVKIPLVDPVSGKVDAGEWLANGCHPLAAIIAVGGPVRRIAVHRAAHGGGICILIHDNGAMSNLHLADGMPPSQPSERYLFIAGKHAVEIFNARQVTYHRGIAFEYGRTTTFAPPGVDGGAITWEAQDAFNTLENKAVFTQGIYGSLSQFCESVLAGTPVEAGSLAFACEITKVYEAAMISNGNFIEIPPG